jgi:hypothetical protein
MCPATNGQLLTNKDQVLSRKTFKREHPRGATCEPKAAEKNDVIIFLPSRDEIVEAMKYLKDNKAASLDSISAELLKGGGPAGDITWKLDRESSVSAVYKKGDKLDCKNYSGICRLNVA